MGEDEEEAGGWKDSREYGLQVFPHLREPTLEPKWWDYNYRHKSFRRKSSQTLLQMAHKINTMATQPPWREVCLRRLERTRKKKGLTFAGSCCVRALKRETAADFGRFLCDTLLVATAYHNWFHDEPTRMR